MSGRLEELAAEFGMVERALGDPEALADLVPGQSAVVMGEVTSAQQLPLRNQPRRKRRG